MGARTSVYVMMYITYFTLTWTCRPVGRWRDNTCHPRSRPFRGIRDRNKSAASETCKPPPLCFLAVQQQQPNSHSKHRQGLASPHLTCLAARPGTGLLGTSRPNQWRRGGRGALLPQRPSSRVFLSAGIGAFGPTVGNNLIAHDLTWVRPWVNRMVHGAQRAQFATPGWQAGRAGQAR
jgi:hypothetical protein